MVSSDQDTYEAALEAVCEVLAALSDKALAAARECSPNSTGDAYSVHAETMATGEYAGTVRSYNAVSNMLHDFRLVASLAPVAS